MYVKNCVLNNSNVIINFRTPIDISAEGPQFDGKALGVQDFSGLYKVWQVINNFSGNEFTQDVSLIRRRNQKQNVSAGTVSNPRYMDKKAYEKRPNNFGYDGLMPTAESLGFDRA